MGAYFHNGYGCEVLDAELEALHDEMLDEVVGDICIGSLTYSASHVLKSTDPIAYRMSVGEYVDVLIEDGELIEVDK